METAATEGKLIAQPGASPNRANGAEGVEGETPQRQVLNAQHRKPKLGPIGEQSEPEGPRAGPRLHQRKEEATQRSPGHTGKKRRGTGYCLQPQLSTQELKAPRAETPPVKNSQRYPRPARTTAAHKADPGTAANLGSLRANRNHGPETAECGGKARQRPATEQLWTDTQWQGSTST